MEDKKIKAFVTKRALTKGILEVEGTLTNDGKYFSSLNPYVWGNPGDFALTKEEAERQVIKKIRSKLRSMEKIRQKLTKMLGQMGKV